MESFERWVLLWSDGVHRERFGGLLCSYRRRVRRFLAYEGSLDRCFGHDALPAGCQLVEHFEPVFYHV